MQTDPETGETCRRLVRFQEDEVSAGLPYLEAVEELVKERV